MCHSGRPCFLKSQPGHTGQNVDTSWRQPDLHDHARGHEVCDGDAERLDRRPEISKSLQNATRVLLLAVDPHVQVSGGTRNSMRGQGVGPDDQKARAGREQLGENVSEVFVQGLTCRGGRESSDRSVFSFVNWYRTSRPKPGLNRQWPHHGQSLLHGGRSAQIIAGLLTLSKLSHRPITARGGPGHSRRFWGSGHAAILAEKNQGQT